ncbi:ureidoglycolate dehydrogenase [Erysipelotrichaceae bacterium OttesenSCG-928-M19]|nr:ureidoglycolate dehydrogenase [Erysipelotrichaceae bacterium OttesenSCG-928-M19]
MSEDYVYVKEVQLRELALRKLLKAGLKNDDASEVVNHLIYADARGVHSHGVNRIRYYCKRIKAGGTNLKPKVSFKQTGPCSGLYEGDNGLGFVVVKQAMKQAIALAKENGIGVVGVKNTDHAGTMSYYLRLAAQEDLIALTMCQSDPGVVPYGGKEVYFGTNPLGYAIPQSNGEPIVFDMATSIQAWGKVANARLKNEKIPQGWAIDKEGRETTDPNQVYAMLPMAGAKGYGLMMLIDILAGSLLGLNFGKHVSYSNEFEKGRSLGQFILVINPNYFGNVHFKDDIAQMIKELHDISPAEGFARVNVPGENSQRIYEEYQKKGIPVYKTIYDYLVNEKE